MFKKILIIFFVTCSAYLCADDKKLTNAEASYIFYYKNIQAGSMNMTIATLDDKINIVTKYDGNFIASLANKGHREETSSIQQKNGNLIPIKYTYIDEKESYEIIFNNNEAKVLSDYFPTMQLKSRNIIYDPISILVLLMKKYPNIENAYSVVSKKKLKIYDFKFNDNISYKINDKNFNCYSVQYKSGNKVNYYYFSKDQKNLLISIKIEKNGKEKIRIDLSNIHHLE
tara:strand:- start:298 stop:981 length:684 start_codon:yes stop_codon:yes gene_type:complete